MEEGLLPFHTKVIRQKPLFSRDKIFLTSQGWRLYKKLHFLGKFFLFTSFPFSSFSPRSISFVSFFFNFPPIIPLTFHLCSPSYFPFNFFSSIFCVLFLLLLPFLLILLFLIVYFSTPPFPFIPLLFIHYLLKIFLLLDTIYYLILLPLLHLSHLFQLHIFVFVNIPSYISKIQGLKAIKEENKKKENSKIMQWKSIRK